MKKGMEHNGGDAVRRRGAGRRARVCLALLCALACASLSLSASASALIHRGHVFGSTFEGTGEHAFTNPSGIAVNEATGEVYVAETAKERVQRFKSDGTFVGEFAAPGVRSIAIDNAAGSPSKGDVYTSGIEKAPKKGEEPETEYNWLYKFSPTGEKIFKKNLFKRKEKVGEGEAEEYEVEFENINGVAVDASGKLWVTWELEGYIAGFTNEETNKLIGSTIKEEALTTEQPPEVGSQLECQAKPGFAVDPNVEFFYLAHEYETGLEECLEQPTTPVVVAKLKGSGQGVTAQLTKANSTGLAVDASNGDVYVDNATSVAAFSASGALIQRFGSPDLKGGGAVAANASTNTVFVAEEGGRIALFVPEGAGAKPDIDDAFPQVLSPSSVKLFAQIDPRGSDTHYYFQVGTSSCVTTPSACTDIPASAPGADLGSGFGDQLVEATLEGLAPDTTYFYRVIASNVHGEVENAQAATTFFTTLPSASAVLADHRQWEMVSPPTKGGALDASSNEFAAAIQAAAGGGALAYGTAKSGPLGEPQGNRSLTVTPTLFTRDSSGWTARDISTPHNKGEGFVAGNQQPEYRVFSPELALSIVQPEGAQQHFPLEQPPLSPPLSKGEVQEKTIYVRDNEPIAPAANEADLYAKAAANREYLAPGYLALVTQVNDTAKNPFGEALGEKEDGFIDATPDLHHVVIASPIPLTTGASGEGLYEWNADDPTQALTYVSVLEGGAPATVPRLGGHAITRNAISEDGSRVFFTSATASEGDLSAYLSMRDTTTKTTVHVNAAQGEHVSEPSEEEFEEESLAETHFQTASKDGSKVFFTDTWPLTDDSTLSPTAGVSSNPSDLYEYDVSSKKLVDLTVARHAGESADVLGALPGAGDDGSRVYFVANGALTGDAKPGNCPKSALGLPEPGAACSLYISEPDSQTGARRTTLIARLSAQDASDWAQGVNTPGQSASEAGNLTYETTRVTHDGRYLAFMSDQSLTGYDNEDASSEAPGERLDQEVFLYDASAGQLVCASCKPGGGRPAGVLDPVTGGQTLLVDRSRVLNGRWLAAAIPGWTPASRLNAIRQANYLTDGGRLFFNSADQLVADDENDKMDVYEYQPQGQGTCTTTPGCVSLISSGAKDDENESAFLDASTNGNDAYFLTAAKLLAQDYDTAFDIYNAGVCGTGESPACLPPVVPPPPECSGEACKAPAVGPPGFGTPASASFNGPGNPPAQGVLTKKTVTPPVKPLTRAQRLSKALKSCRSKFKHKKHKRSACEKSARKKYGSKSKAKKSRAKQAAGHRGGASR